MNKELKSVEFTLKLFFFTIFLELIGIVLIIFLLCHMKEIWAFLERIIA